MNVFEVKDIVSEYFVVGSLLSKDLVSSKKKALNQ